jgi:hypothetical protein
LNKRTARNNAAHARRRLTLALVTVVLSLALVSVCAVLRPEVSAPVLVASVSAAPLASVVTLPASAPPKVAHTHKRTRRTRRACSCK